MNRSFGERTFNISSHGRILELTYFTVKAQLIYLIGFIRVMTMVAPPFIKQTSVCPGYSTPRGSDIPHQGEVKRQLGKYKY